MFWDIFVALCTKHKTTPTAVVGKLGLAKGNVTSWKKGKVPQAVTQKKIADFFGVDAKIFSVENENDTKKASTDLGGAIDSNVVTIIGRDGKYTKKELSDEQAKLLQDFIRKMPNVKKEI